MFFKNILCFYCRKKVLFKLLSLLVCKVHKFEAELHLFLQYLLVFLPLTGLKDDRKAWHKCGIVRF